MNEQEIIADAITEVEFELETMREVIATLASRGMHRSEFYRHAILQFKLLSRELRILRD